MTRQELVEQIRKKNSYLCIGLDTDISKIPKHLQSHPDPVFEFNKQIIDSTKDLCVAYKINTAFYEAMGLKGWEALGKTVNYLPDSHFRIADAKRGDIGNTSSQYAKAFFEQLQFDAITVAPYMGADSVKPFLEYRNKWTIILGLTSNPGAADFELKKIIREWDDLEEGMHVRKQEVSYLYEAVMKEAAEWGTPDNLMFVVGATLAGEFTTIRKMFPEHFFLVPGVGAQGGSLRDISRNGMNSDCGLLVNVSRSIIYASEKEDFASEARAISLQYVTEMKQLLGK